jgi:hypothetical protein
MPGYNSRAHHRYFLPLISFVFLVSCPHLAIRCGNRCSIIVRELVHRFESEPLAIRRPGIMRCHGAAGPSEDGLELRDGRAVVRRPSRRDLAHTVRRARHLRCAAGITEYVAEGFLGWPRSPAMKVRSPQGPASKVRASTGKMGSVTATVNPLFSVLIVPTPSLTC